MRMSKIESCSSELARKYVAFLIWERWDVVQDLQDSNMKHKHGEATEKEEDEGQNAPGAWPLTFTINTVLYLNMHVMKWLTENKLHQKQMLWYRSPVLSASATILLHQEVGKWVRVSRLCCGTFCFWVRQLRDFLNALQLFNYNDMKSRISVN